MRSEPLSRDEWIQLLTEQIEELRPILDQITLPALGQLKCYSGYGVTIWGWVPSTQSLGSGSPTVTGPKELILDTRGFFFPYHSKGKPADEVWGLIRTGKLIKAKITTEVVPDTMYSKVMAVEIDYVTIEELLEGSSYPPSQYFYELAVKTREAAWERQQLWQKVQRVAEGFDHAKELLKAAGYQFDERRV